MLNNPDQSGLEAKMLASYIWPWHGLISLSLCCQNACKGKTKYR